MGKTPEKSYLSSSSVLAMGMRYRRKVPITQDSENSNSVNKEAVIAPAEAPVTAANVVPVTKHEKLKQKQQQRRKLVRESNSNQEVDAVDFAKPQHGVVAVGSKVEPVESDNQAEQRREESAVEDVVTGSNQPQEDGASSPVRDGPSYTRKKKHKPVVSNQETSTSSSSVATSVSGKKKSSEKPRKESFRAARGKESMSLMPEVIEVVPEPPVVVESPVVEVAVSMKQQQSLEPAIDVTAASTAAVPVASPKAKRQKKKKNKRNVVQDDSTEVAESDKSSEKSDALPTEPIIVPTVPVESTRVQEPPPTQIEQQPRPRKESAPELRRRKQFNSKKGNNPSLMKQLLWKVKPIQPKPVTSLEASPATEVIQETESATQINEEEEEIAYAAGEQHSLKLHTSSVTKSMSPCVVESSSQETQSGSEDELSFVQYGLSPSEESREGAYGMGSELDLLDSFFPTPLSLDAMESLKLRSPSVRIHEILLEDFVFSPAELFIVKGDLVVWRVSKQTLGMVEHSLDATLFDTAGNHVRKTSTPLLGPGSGFTWRFDVAGRVDVECSVYKSQCVVHVSEDPDAKKRATLKPVSATTNSQRRKKKTMTKAKRAAKAVIATASQPEADGCEKLVTRSDSSEPVVVFHPAKDLTRVPEMDAGVCRAVLSQLEEVKTVAEASFIVVGDIPCPVVGEAEGDERVEPESRADDVEDNQVDASEAAETDGVVDFQQRIIAMLQKSEASQMRQRSSFFVEGSRFNAGGAYDFFKRRFAQVQSADEPMVYSLCPERQASAGVELSDLLNVLVANKV